MTLAIQPYYTELLTVRSPYALVKGSLPLIATALADIALYRRYGYKGTISWVIWAGAHRWLVIAFLAGMLAGHFFWSQ
jgi:hypothetical protein